MRRESVEGGPLSRATASRDPYERFDRARVLGGRQCQRRLSAGQENARRPLRFLRGCVRAIAECRVDRKRRHRRRDDRRERGPGVVPVDEGRERAHRREQRTRIGARGPLRRQPRIEARRSHAVGHAEKQSEGLGRMDRAETLDAAKTLVRIRRAHQRAGRAEADARAQTARHRRRRDRRRWARVGARRQRGRRDRRRARGSVEGLRLRAHGRQRNERERQRNDERAFLAAELHFGAPGETAGGGAAAAGQPFFLGSGDATPATSGHASCSSRSRRCRRRPPDIRLRLGSRHGLPPSRGTGRRHRERRPHRDRGFAAPIRTRRPRARAGRRQRRSVRARRRRARRCLDSVRGRSDRRARGALATAWTRRNRRARVAPPGLRGRGRAPRPPKSGDRLRRRRAEAPWAGASTRRPT